MLERLWIVFDRQEERFKFVASGTILLAAILAGWFAVGVVMWVWTDLVRFFS
jgi:hypothetical protein